MPVLHAFLGHRAHLALASKALPALGFFLCLWGEAPNKEVCEAADHAPIEQPALLLAGGPEKSVHIWPPLDQHCMLSFYFAALVSFVNTKKKKKKWPQTEFS